MNLDSGVVHATFKLKVKMVFFLAETNGFRVLSMPILIKFGLLFK